MVLLILNIAVKYEDLNKCGPVIKLNLKEQSSRSTS